MPSFVRVKTDSESVMLNLELLISVDEIRPGHCRLDFGPGRIIEIEGDAATVLIHYLGEKVLLDSEGTITDQELDLPAPLGMSAAVGTPRRP